MQPRNQNNQWIPQVREFDEKVVQIRRVSKKTKGGNTIRFSALVVIGDKKGRVGLGVEKAGDVRTAIQKAVNSAKKTLITVPMRGTTVAYEVNEKFSAAKILLKPAPKGTGIIAGGTMRVVLEAAGIRDAVGKILGTKNKISNVYATFQALKTLIKMDERKNNKQEAKVESKEEKVEDKEETKPKTIKKPVKKEAKQAKA
ncbi:30S ribosomal protein S5 [Candidatus Microgenomates bacterium]|nr:30S ribosomal protein S5 [Candidatus Microgenomates bacterium]